MGKYKNIIIVVDAQYDFVSGSLALPNAKQIVNNIVDYIKDTCYEEDFNGNNRFDNWCYELVFTRDTHYNDYLNTFEGKKLPVKHCMIYTPGWCIVDELYGEPAKYLDKKYFGHIDWKNYFNHIEVEPTTITIMGFATDICVVSNAIILRNIYNDIPIKVVSNCCAGTSPELHQAALDVMGSCQIEII